MLNFGWSEFDPLEGSITSIDPLRSLANSVQLGNLIFPGTSGRVWRIRYMSALCYLLKHSDLERDANYRANYLKFRKYENAYIICLAGLKKKFLKTNDFMRVIGLERADQLIRSNPGAVSIDGDILANQMNLGPLGVHAVLMKDLGLLEDDRELMLLPQGEVLADQFEAAIGKNSAKFLERISDTRVKNVQTEYFDEITDQFVMEYRHRSQESEKNQIAKLLLSNSTRKSLFNDLLSLKAADKQELTESQLIDLLAQAESPLKLRYQLIKSYDVHQRYVNHFFDTIRNVPKDSIQFSLKDNLRIKQGFEKAKGGLSKSVQDLISSSEQYLSENEDGSADVNAILSNTRQILEMLSDYATFTQYIVKFHETHQREKGKAPWVRFYSPTHLEVAPHYALSDALPGIKESGANNIHSYRLSNALKMIGDLKLESLP